MSQSFSSPTIPPPESEPNEQVAGNHSVSSSFSRQISQKESSLSKNPPITRKPNSQIASLQSYKSIKRKSQQKGNKLDATPPKYPKMATQLKRYSSKNEQISQIGNLQELQTEQMIKFKQKPLTKQEIIQIKDYVQGLEKEQSLINSLAGTEKPTINRAIQPSFQRDSNKKSKTQYFQIQEFQRGPQNDATESQSLQQTDRNFIASLKLKCKSVDESNSLLQKRISWLREEVEMHLQRQLSFDKMKDLLEKQIHKKDRQIQVVRVAHFKQKQTLIMSIQERDRQIERLKNLFIDLHNKFEDERQGLTQQIEFLRSEREAQVEQKLLYQDQIKDLQLIISNLMLQKKEIQVNTIPETYPNALTQKLMEQNKYLKVQNHILAKYKDQVKILQKQLKKVNNERDNFKKKIIQSAKRDRKKILDESDDSSFFTLSQISMSEGSFKRT